MAPLLRLLPTPWCGRAEAVEFCVFGRKMRE